MVVHHLSLNQLVDLFAVGKVARSQQSSTAVQDITSAAKFAVGEAEFPTLGKKVFEPRRV